MKIYLSIILLLLSVSFVYALGPVGEKGITVQVQNNTITIGGYTIVQDPSTGINIKVTSDNLFINKVSSSTGLNITCNSVNIPVIENGTYNGNNQSIIPGYNFSVNYLIDIPFTSQNITNQSNLFCISQEKYEQCITEKAQYSTGMNSCTESKKDIKDVSSNFTTCSTNLQTTSTSLQICNSDKDSADKKVTDMETKIKDTQNQRYIWAGIAGVLCILGTLYFKGHIGGPKAHDPEQNFNRTQAG